MVGGVVEEGVCGEDGTRKSKVKHRGVRRRGPVGEGSSTKGVRGGYSEGQVRVG